MDFALTEEQELIRSSAERVAAELLAPRAAELDRSGDPAILGENLRALADLGFMGLNVGAEYGGTEAGSVAFSLAITEIGRACASTAVTVSVNNMVAEVVQAIGSEEQKTAYLPSLCSGDFAAAGFCLSETEAGSDPAAMKTRAVRDAEGWVLTGNKFWITSASIAGLFVVWAVTDPDAPRGKGISCFLVPADIPGIEIGKAEEKMGQKGSGTHEVRFDACRLPGDALLGEENQGLPIAINELAGGRIGIASLALGVAGAALDAARAYLHERKQFGRFLSEFQGLRWMLAEAYTEMEAARLLTLRAAALKESGRPYAQAASMAKWMATEKGNQACYVALQLFGGNGYIKEYPLERYARDLRVTTLYEGSSEIQKQIISQHLLRS